MAATGSVRPVIAERATSSTISSASSRVSSGRNPYSTMGVYLTPGSMKRADFYDQTLQSLVEAGASSVIFDVKGSYVYFATNAPLPNEISLVLPSYDLPAVIQKAHDKGLYVIGRFIALKDPLFAERRPEVQIRHPVSGVSVGSLWVDGSAPLVHEYNRQVLVKLIQSEIDEVNFDYIRFPTEYPPQAIGILGREKADKVESFLLMARRTIDEVNPNVKLGISTYAILGWNYPINVEALGQDFVRFAPLVDVISPMAYPNSFAQNAYYRPGKDPRSRMYFLVWRTLDGYAKLLGPEHAWKLRPWIQGYGATAKDMREQIDAVYDAGMCGFLVWNAANAYGVSYEAISGLPEPPERCR